MARLQSFDPGLSHPSMIEHLEQYIQYWTLTLWFLKCNQLFTACQIRAFRHRDVTQERAEMHKRARYATCRYISLLSSPYIRLQLFLGYLHLTLCAVMRSAKNQYALLLRLQAPASTAFPRHIATLTHGWQSAHETKRSCSFAWIARRGRPSLDGSFDTHLMKALSRRISTKASSPKICPTEITGDATVGRVARILSESRAAIEVYCTSAKKRREAATEKQIGINVVKWLRQLGGLDEHHIISQQFCRNLGWFLVAEGNEDAMISLLIEEGSSQIESAQSEKISRDRFNAPGKDGNRIRRRHDQLSSLMAGHAALSPDGTADGAIRCLQSILAVAGRAGPNKLSFGGAHQS